MLVAQRYMQKPVSLPYLHSWVAAHFNRLISQFEGSLHHEPLIPMGAALDHTPAPMTSGPSLHNRQRQASPLTCGNGARGRIRTDDLPITRRNAFVQQVPARAVLAAHVSRVVRPVRS